MKKISSPISSYRFKALTVTAGFSLWFFILTSATDIFAWYLFVGFVTVLVIVTQILAKKLTSILDIFAAINTKIFLGIVFVFVISLYGILFRILSIDLLRIRTGSKQSTYWLPMESRTMRENLGQS